MQVTELTQAQQNFLNELRGQMSPDVCYLFDRTLIALGLPVKEIQKRLDKLDALEAAGVDNWEGYNDTLEGFTDEEESDE
jgi:hypothetical protein